MLERAEEIIRGMLLLMNILGAKFGVIGIEKNKLDAVKVIRQKVAGLDVPLKIKYVDGQVGVNGRNSDNQKIEEVLGWRPTEPLVIGMKKTFEWIKNELESKGKKESTG